MDTVHEIATFRTQREAEDACIRYSGASMAAQPVRSGSRWRVRIDDRANWVFGWLGEAGECVEKHMHVDRS
jgi:hypothetical protein